MGNETNAIMYHVTVTILRASIHKGFTFEGSCEELPVPEVGEQWSFTFSEVDEPDEVKSYTSPIVEAMIHWSAKRIMRFSTFDIEYRLEYSVAQA